MKVAAIICEYNPFHNGHLYQIKEIRRILGEDTAIIGIMSGNFTQRGDSAIADKYTRAKIAVLSGLSLILEIPFPYCSSSAENYARCSVDIANRLGCVDYLCFGCEDDDIASLTNIAKMLDSDEFKYALKKRARKKETISLGHAKLNEQVFASLSNDKYANIITKPNNILAIEYIRALNALNSKIIPLSILRKGAAHDSEIYKDGYASASLIRQNILDDIDVTDLIPNPTKNLFDRARKDLIAPSDFTRLSNAILAFLRITPPEIIDKMYECSGGLGYRLHACARDARNLQELTKLASTKKYTNARIRRALLFALIGITSSDIYADAPYTQILALDTVGQALLAKVKKTSCIPILTKPADSEKLPQYAKEAAKISFRADSIYSLTLPECAPNIDFVKMSPYRKTDESCLNLNK